MKYGDRFWRVELHVHLDGAYRPATIMDLAEKRGITLPSSGSVEEFTEFLRMKKLGNLEDFLLPFPILSQVVGNNKEAIRRTTYEFVEDCASQKIAYVETRIPLHCLAGDEVTTDDVAAISTDALREAGEKFGVNAKLIVSTLRGNPDWSQELLDVANKFKDKGLVGIDLAGDELLNNGEVDETTIKVFAKAKELGISRTVHAGENGPAASVRQAVYQMEAQRIGHGYRVLQDMQLYDELRAKDIHFETCPLSSHLTGGAPPDWSQHPIITFAKDKANYSINTDDPIITGHNLTQEYELCREKLHLDDKEIQRCILNAARSAFIGEDEKAELINHLKKVFNEK